MVETERYDDAWFNALSPAFKLAWDYLCAKCDNSGVWDRNFPLATTHIFGPKALDPRLMEMYGIDWEEFFVACEGRIEITMSKKWWIVGFIPFQCRAMLSPACIPHVFIINLLRKHSLLQRFEMEELRIWGNSIYLKSVKAEETAAEAPPPSAMELALSMEPSPSRMSILAQDVLDHINSETGRQRENKFRAAHLPQIVNALKSVNGDVDGVKKMVTRMAKLWTSEKMQEHLNPRTLFRKSNFPNYYDKRNDPIYEHAAHLGNSGKNNRTDGTLNATRTGQYAGVGKMAKIPDVQRPAT